MKHLYTLRDDQFEFKGITHDRHAARAIILNEKNEIALLRVYGEDDLGFRDYYETPGGGVKPYESIEQAVIREAEEEIGYKCEIICNIGYVDDYYNIICRHNITHYFLLRTIEKTTKHLEEYETKLIDNVLWFHIDEAIKTFENCPDNKFSILIKRREIPILKIAKEIMKGVNKNDSE